MGEDALYDEHYSKTVTRNQEGRFLTTLPVKSNISDLGNSRDRAIRRFYQLEKRLQKNVTLKDQYVDFMEEYIRLGHMERIGKNKILHISFQPLSYKK